MNEILKQVAKQCAKNYARFTYGAAFDSERYAEDRWEWFIPQAREYVQLLVDCEWSENISNAGVKVLCHEGEAIDINNVTVDLAFKAMLRAILEE